MFALVWVSSLAPLMFLPRRPNVTDLVAMVAMWLAPSFYTWHQVASQVPDWAFQEYIGKILLLVAVGGFHRWFLVGDNGQGFTFAHGWTVRFNCQSSYLYDCAHYWVK